MREGAQEIKENSTYEIELAFIQHIDPEATEIIPTVLVVQKST